MTRRARIRYDQRHVDFRTSVNFLTSLAVAVASVLGLNAGVVTHVDHDGRLALDFAHVVHAAADSDAVPCGGHDHCAGDPAHAPLHAAMAVMAEAARGRPEPAPSGVASIRLARQSPAPGPPLSGVDLARRLTQTASKPLPRCAHTPPPQLLSLETIVLTV